MKAKILAFIFTIGMISPSFCQERLDKIMHIWGEGMPYTKSKLLLDHSGNIYLYGMFENPIYFGSEENVVFPEDSTDVFITKIYSDGSLAWTKIISGLSSEWLLDMKIDEAGFVYFIGEFSVSLRVDDLYVEAENPDPDFINSEGFLCKLDSDGNLVRLIRRNINDEKLAFEKLSLDASGNIYLIGMTTGDQVFGMPFQPQSVPNFGFAGFLLRLNSSFGVDWISDVCDKAGFQYQNGMHYTSIVKGDDAHLYVAGHMYNSDENHAFIAKITPDDSLVWCDTLVLPDYTMIEEILSDRAGNVFARWGWHGQFAKFSSTGERLWHTSIESRVWTSVVNPEGYWIASYFKDYGTIDGFIIIDPDGKVIYDHPFETIQVEQLAMDDAGNIYYNGSFIEGISIGGEDIDPENGNNYIIGQLKVADIIGEPYTGYRSRRVSFDLYPNPTNSLLTIETEQPVSRGGSIEIISLAGQLIYSTEMEGTTKQIDMTKFKKGVYFITVKSEEFVRTEKVVKL